MRVAVLSDVHGNAIALAACLARVRDLEVERIFLLGDLVGYFPGECEALVSLEGVGAICQKGNHEAYLLSSTAQAARHAEIYGLDGARKRLGPERLASIAAWPERRKLDVGSHKALLVHGAPDDPLEGYVYPDSDLSAYRDLPYDVVFMGHTHHPFIRWEERTLLVNGGSVGLPRDVGNAASFALFDGATGDCCVVRVRFDVEDVLRAYGHAVHEQVRSCLYRRATEAVEDIIAGREDVLT